MTPVANFHYPQTFPDSEKKKKPTRHCGQCWKKEIRKESQYVCGDCVDQPALCIDPCFWLYLRELGILENLQMWRI